MSQNQGQQQPSDQDILKRLRNNIKLAISDSEEIILDIVKIYEKQLMQAGGQIQASATEITRLQELCKKHKIDFSPPPAPKGPNRAERRAASKTKKKATKKSKSKA